MWKKCLTWAVVVACPVGKGFNPWVEVPASGASTKGLKFPAALLDVSESGAAGHQH